MQSTEPPRGGGSARAPSRAEVAAFAFATIMQMPATLGMAASRNRSRPTSRSMVERCRRRRPSKCDDPRREGIGSKAVPG